MNLCPCGGQGDAAGCTCSAPRLAAFREKVSRALLDRFDLVVAMPRPRSFEFDGPAGESSAAVRERVVHARTRLRAERPRTLRSARTLLADAVERFQLSGRGRERVLDVARTIAALAATDAVAAEHIAEALSYRVPSELIAA